MKRLYKPFLIVTYLLLFGAFTSTSLGQLPISPGNTDTGISQGLTQVDWTAFGTLPQTYSAEFSTTGAFGGEQTVLTVGSGGADIFATGLPALSYNTTYYWRVKNIIDGAWNSYSFTTEIATPAITNLAGSPTGVVLSPTIDWTFAGGTTGVTFDVQYSTDNFVADINTEASGLAGATTSHSFATTLANNTTYKIRVLAKKNLEPDKTSNAPDFTTLLATPVNATPSGSALYSTPTAFTWTMSPSYSNVDFLVTVYTVSGDPAGSTVGTSTVNNLTTNIAIANAGVYYYTVKATVNDGGAANNGETNTSTESSFTLTLSAPTLTSPASPSTGNDLDVLLDWSDVAGADRYTLEVNTDPSFAGGTAIAVGGNPQTVSEKAPGGLSDNKTYYWRVTASNSVTGQTGPVSSTFNFTTTQQGDGTFPLDNAVGVVLFPTLTWPTGPTGTDTYRLEVNTAVGFGGTVIYDDATLTATSQQIAGLSNGTEYFWRVTASSNLAKVNSSTVFSFTTSTDKYVTLGYPKNGDIVSSLKPTLNWSVTNSVSGLTYDIDIATNNTFTTGLIQMTNISGTSTAVTTVLVPGQTYYWRARSKTSGGLYSQWSSTGTFAPASSLSASPIPTILWPQGNPTQYTATPTLSWYLTSLYTGVTIDHYVIEISENADPSTATVQTITTSTNATTISTNSGLTPGTKYYWHVKSVTSGNVTSSASNIGSFTIDIGQGGSPTPILSWPIGGVTVYSITPTFYWYLGTGTTGTITYDVQVDATDNTFGDIIGSVTGTSPQSWTFSPASASTPLLAGNTYYWRVRTKNGGTPGDWSAAQTFTVASNVSSAPNAVLSYPTGGATVFNTKPSLYWYLAGPPPSGETITYDIKVDNNSNFLSPEDTKLANTTQSYTVVTALTPDTYYWQVRVNNTTAGTNSGYLPATGTSANSFVVASTASGAGVAPTPLFPTGNSVVASLTPTLTWIANGVVPSGATYEVELKPTTLAFDGAGLVTGILTNSLTTVTLTAGTAYHWRVRIRHTSLVPNPSTWSVEALFTTAATLAPPPPMVGDPINGVTVPNSTPEISWFLPTAPNAVLKYRLQIFEDMAMNNIAVELDDIDAFSTVVNTLKGGTTYYWRVQSKNDLGEYSAHSNVGRFTTMSVTGIDDLNIIPTEFDVSQNYPNPFNPSTTIRFAIPEASFVILKIYNMLGQEVKTLVNAEKNAGTYNVQWRGDNDFGQKVSSGTYIYRVIAGQNIFVKKMILLK